MSQEFGSFIAEAENKGEILPLDPENRRLSGEAAEPQTPGLSLVKNEPLVASSDPSSPFWKELITSLLNEIHADIALLFGCHGETREWFLLSSTGMPPSFGNGKPLARGWQSLAAIIAQEEHHTLFSDDITADRRFVGQMIRGTAVRTFAGTTLETEAGCLGALIMGWNVPAVMAEEERALFLSHAQTLRSVLTKQKWDGAAPTPTPAPPPPPSAPPPVAAMTAPPPSVRQGENGRPKQSPLPHRRDDLRSSPAPAPSRPGEDARMVPLLEALLSLFPAIFQGENPYKELLRKIVLIMEADVGYIFQWDPTPQRLFPVASDGVSPEMVRRVAQSGIRPDILWMRVIEKNQALLHPFENWKPPFKKKLLKDENFKCQITIPLPSAQTHNPTWGLLVLFYRAQTPSQKELKLLEAVGERIGIAIRGITQWDALHKKVACAAVTQKFCGTPTDDNFSFILDSVKEAVRASNVYLLIVDESRNCLTGYSASTHALKAIMDVEIRLDEPTVAALAVKQNRPFVIEHAPSDSRVSPSWIELFRSRSLCAIPLVLQERVMGVLMIDETAYVRRFTEEEIETVTDLIPSASMAISTALKYQNALSQREHQEILTTAVLRMYEDEQSALKSRLEQETAKMLEKAQQGIREVHGTLAPLVPDHPALQPLAENNALLEKATANLKTILTDIHPSELERQGLIAAVREYVHDFSTATGISVTLNLSSLKRNSVGFERLVYRIIQEALANVKKHAGAKAVILALESKEPFWHLSITDNGQGFDARRYFSIAPTKRKGTGILGMKARTDLLGGIFFIESTPQQGTRVSVKIPAMKKDGL